MTTRCTTYGLLAGGFCCLLATACFSDDGSSGLPPLGSGSDDGDGGDGGDSGVDDDGGQTDVPPPSDSTAELRIVHASPDAGPVDIYAAGDQEPLFTGLTYGDASEWSEIEAAALSIEIRVSGADPTSAPLYSESLDLADGQRVNAIAAGLVDGETASKFHVLPVVEGWGNDVAGRARVRFVHAGPDLPSVAFEGAGSQASELEPFSASGAEGSTIDIEGGVRLQVLSAGGGSEQITSFTSPQIAEGDDVLLVATGLAGSLGREPDGLRLLAIGASGPLEPILQDPQLFVLHGSGDSQSLELCSGTQEVAANFTYGDIVPTRVSPGTYDLEIFNYPAGCTGNALNGTGNATSFEAGERYLMLLTGEQTADAGEASIQAASFVDEFTLDDDQNARIRFVHGASYSQIYVGSVTGGAIEAPNVFTQPIAWRTASVETAVGAGPVLLGIADAVGAPPPPYSPIVTFDYAAAGGERQWGIVAGHPSPDDPDDRFLQLLLVDSEPSEWTVTTVDVN